MEFVDEGKVINDYGATVPDEYGGVYSEPIFKFVALFTRDLEHHLAELRKRLPFPENVRVERAPRPYREIERENQVLQQRLIFDRRHPGVTTVGITMTDGQFIVMVGVYPYDDETAAAVREVAAPYPVIIRKMGPFHQVADGAPRSEPEDSPSRQQWRTTSRPTR